MALLGTKPKVVRDIVLNCVVLHNMMKTHKSGLDRAPTPADDKASIANKPIVYVPDENYRMEEKHQQDQLKDYFNHIGALAGQEDKI